VSVCAGDWGIEERPEEDAQGRGEDAQGRTFSEALSSVSPLALSRFLWHHVTMMSFPPGAARRASSPTNLGLSGMCSPLSHGPHEVEGRVRERGGHRVGHHQLHLNRDNRGGTVTLTVAVMESVTETGTQCPATVMYNGVVFFF